jgi:hypothetical protein
LNKLKSELEELNQKYNSDELELTYYDVKEKVINFFEKLTVDEKRQALVRIINKCQLFGKYLIIDTGKLLFIFNITENYELPETIFEEFKNDQYFKDNFLNQLFDSNGEYPKEIQQFLNTPKEEAVNKYSEIDLIDIENKILLHLITRRLGDSIIKEYRLKDKIKSFMKTKLQQLKIIYPLDDIIQIISFTEDI